MEQYEREVQLIDYIEVILKHKRSIIGGTLLCALLTWFYVQSGPQGYEAQTLIAVSPAIASVGQTGSQEGRQGVPGTEIIVPGLAAESYRELATGDELVSSVRDSLLRLDLTEEIRQYVSTTSLAGMAGMLNAELMQKTVTGKSPLLAFRVQSVLGELPVAIVNLWANMFVQRHRGLSSNVADDYYRWVQSQYNTYKEKLENTEDNLRHIQAAYSSLNVLGVEVGIKTTRLDSALNEYQVTKMDLEATQQELAYLQDRLAAVELAGHWLGYSPSKEIFEAAQSVEKMPTVRRSLIEALVDLEQAERDSLRLAAKHEDQRERYLAERRRKLLTFERETGIDRIRRETAYLESLLVMLRTDDAQVGERLKLLGDEIEVNKRNREVEPQVRLVSKAITNEALWQQVIRGGKIDEGAQGNLAKLRLVEEKPNPIYEELSATIRRLQVEHDLAQLQSTFAKKQISDKEERLLVRRSMLDTMAVQERALLQELESERIEFERSVSKEAIPLVNRIRRKRETVTAYEDVYSQRQQRAETLHRSLVTLQSKIRFNQNSFENWSAQIREKEAATDSIRLVQTRLERDLPVFQATFEKFANLVEKARIARQQAAGDIQIVSQAVVARPVARGTVKKVSMAAMAGLIASIMLAFLVEYLGRARHQEPATRPE